MGINAHLVPNRIITLHDRLREFGMATLIHSKEVIKYPHCFW